MISIFGLDLNLVVTLDSTVEAGESATFNCSVPGVPERLIPDLQLSWILDSVELSSLTGSSFLELPSTNWQVSESGNYTCNLVIMSDMFAVETSTKAFFILTVKGKNSKFWYASMASSIKRLNRR